MLQKTLKVFKAFQRLHQFLEVFQPPRSFRRFVVQPHRRVARLLKDHLGQFDVSIFLGAQLVEPTVEVANQFGQPLATLTLDRAAFHSDPRAFDQRHAIGAGQHLDRLHRLVAQAAAGRVDDAFKRQIVVLRDRQAEIGHRVADLHPLIEARTTDDAIGQTNGQETVLKGAHLVRGAHEDGHIVQRHPRPAPRARLHRLDLFTDPAGFFVTVPMADQADLLATLSLGPQFFAQTAFVAGDHAGCGGQNMRGRAIVLFQPDHLRTRKILFKP